MIKDQLLRIFPVEGVGSGVIIDKKGYILTNNHVIEKANKLKVTTTDGNVYDGMVVGTDSVTDLAIIKIESKDALSYAELGNSDELKIGQIVIAIGNPFGLDGGPSVTAGIISSLSRKLQFERGIMESCSNRRIDQSWQFRGSTHKYQRAGNWNKYCKNALCTRYRICSADKRCKVDYK